MDYDGLIKIEDLPSSENEDAEGLTKLAREAESFLTWHNWCGAIRQGYLDFDWYGILALFYFEIEPASPNADNRLWVIVGDAPPAYLDMQSCPTETAAIEGYVYELQRWVDAVKAGQSVDELMPVYWRVSLLPIEPTLAFAQDLERRLDFFRTEIISHMPQASFSQP
jgi:hypothetical protein